MSRAMPHAYAVTLGIVLAEGDYLLFLGCASDARTLGNAAKLIAKGARHVLIFVAIVGLAIVFVKLGTYSVWINDSFRGTQDRLGRDYGAGCPATLASSCFGKAQLIGHGAT